MPNSPTHALSIDIGGTFTDFSLLDLATGEVSVHKVLTNPNEPQQALMEGAIEALTAASAAFKRLSVVVHSTTLTTNSIIQRRGAKTALITTAGFRDILEMGREQMYDMYDLHARMPEPLVPRHLRRGVSERVTRDGDVIRTLDEEEALSIVDELVAHGVKALAVSFIHAYKNADHERSLQALAAERHPDLAISISSEVAPVINEYERTSTTVADAYMKPAVSQYLRGVESGLAEHGYGGRLLVMLSEGGVMDSGWARRHPVRLLESGPAAGALAAGFYGKLLGKLDLVSLDMGGTTAKTCVIENGRAAVTNFMEIDRVQRFRKGSGLPIIAPVLDLIEIGAGGGSIAWIDNLGLLKVGPESAGADPGPACYGLGGVQPTVTDADLLLGYLDPEYFLGGRMRLDPKVGANAMAGLAGRAGLSAVEAAWGINRVVAENMASAARIHIIERNKDPRNYALMAFGGAGPVHACEVARRLGVREVIAPLGAGVTSALGCLTVPLSFEGVRSLPALLSDTGWETVNSVFGEMEAQGRAMLTAAGVPADDVELTRTADMRLSGQIHEVQTPVPDGPLDAVSAERIAADFGDVYRELYGRRSLDIPIEVQNWRLQAMGPEPQVRLRRRATRPGADASTAHRGSRSAYFEAADGYVDCPVYDRYALEPGSVIEGPAIVEERESTAVLDPNDTARIDEWLNLTIEVGDVHG